MRNDIMSDSLLDQLMKKIFKVSIEVPKEPQKPLITLENLKAFSVEINKKYRKEFYTKAEIDGKLKSIVEERKTGEREEK